MQEIIKSYEQLESIVAAGYVLNGPHDDQTKNMRAVKGMLARGYPLVPEEWFPQNGYKFVEPSTFTKNYRLAYKTSADGKVDQYFKSKYCLAKGEERNPLYMKYEGGL